MHQRVMVHNWPLSRSRPPWTGPRRRGGPRAKMLKNLSKNKQKHSKTSFFIVIIMVSQLFHQNFIKNTIIIMVSQLFASNNIIKHYNYNGFAAFCIKNTMKINVFGSKSYKTQWKAMFLGPKAIKRNENQCFWAKKQGKHSKTNGFSTFWDKKL